MAQVQCEIDSIRVAAAYPDRLTVILKRKEAANAYLPLWIGQHEGQALADLLNQRTDSSEDVSAFLTDHGASHCDIQGAMVHLKGGAFVATVLLSRHSEPHGAGCPVGLALALAVRAGAPILVDEALFDTAGVHLD